MSDHSDGIGEAVDDILRQLVMAAARLGEVAARARQEQLTQARAESERAGRELEVRFEAEHRAARATLAPIRDPKWWEGAAPEQIGASYQTAVSWAGQDPEIADTLKHMDERLAGRGVVVTDSMPDRVSELLQSREWAARENPFMDGAWTREMAQARTADERDRLNVGLVSAWLSRPETQPADPAAAQAASLEADKLASAATREEDTAVGERHDGDRAAVRAEDHRHEQPAPDLDGPTAEDQAWLAQQDADREDQVASESWDNADRREAFAQTLRGKGDQASREARMLADVSQATHPSAAVKTAPQNAPKARKTKPKTGHTLTKGSR
ncbi:hypothetical protein [Arthrobacter bambusae]|uniref:hypothetical protein n=1 Tax=Arthrobacter bambusae TaxID=1338426 RepID=UPI0027891023|nr:hypothetical protein [Arthrobacter bambusae]MDQ0241477.1 negative regulator of replication initiation [Arthrobacter bambusae]